MADKGFDLGDYVQVKDRIARFYELFGSGRLVTEGYELTREPDDKPKVIIRAAAYRTPDDPHPGIGLSWMYLPGATPYTKGSEIENAETSAWGRAIGSLGILIDGSIATANEVASKQGEAAEPHKPDRAITPSDEPAYIGPWSESGHLVVRKQGPADGLVRQSPEGPILVVAMGTVDQKTLQILARGDLAQDLSDAAGSEMDGLVCTVEGDLYRVPWSKAGKPMPPYQRLTLSRISTLAWTLPEPLAPSVPDDESELDGLLS